MEQPIAIEGVLPFFFGESVGGKNAVRQQKTGNDYYRQNKKNQSSPGKRLFHDEIIIDLPSTQVNELYFNDWVG